MFDAGDLAIVHATGYPNANRFHFRATDIWTTAEPERIGTSGWLGRYCDATCKGEIRRITTQRARSGTGDRDGPGTAARLVGRHTTR